jgi:hypothetical protein
MAAHEYRGQSTSRWQRRLSKLGYAISIERLDWLLCTYHPQEAVMDKKLTKEDRDEIYRLAQARKFLDWGGKTESISSTPTAAELRAATREFLQSRERGGSATP